MKLRTTIWVAALALLVFARVPLAAGAQSLSGFERAARLAPNDPQAQFNLGVMCLRAGEAARAARALKRATGLNPGDAEAWEAYGDALLALKRPAAAAAALGRSTALDPKRAPAWEELGQALAAEGGAASLDAAVRAYARAARLEPGDARPTLNEGLLLARLGRTRRAVPLLRRAAALPGGAAAFKALCVLYNKAGDYPSAEAACRSAAQDGGGAQCWYNLGFALERGGKADQARTAYASAVAADPSDAPSLYALAFLDFQAGHAGRALRGFRAALKARGGDYPEAEYNIAVLLGDAGHYGQAAALYRDFLKAHPGDSGARANLAAVIQAGTADLLARGQDAYQRGDVAAARADWRRALALDPDDAQAPRMLALTRRAAADAAARAARAARAAARRAVARKLAAQDAAVRARGLAAFAAGRDTDAVRLLGFYARTHPRDAAARTALTRAQARLRAAVDALVSQGTSALAAGDRARASRLAGRALALEPASVRAGRLRSDAGRAPAPAPVKVDEAAVRRLYYHGVDQYLAGDLAGAVETWTSVLKAQPGDLDARRSLAQATLELKALRRLAKG